MTKFLEETKVTSDEFHFNKTEKSFIGMNNMTKEVALFLQRQLELVSKELNHLAATLHVYAGV
jgi:hypothetical protein